MEPSTYPVTFSVDYPDRDLNRLLGTDGRSEYALAVIGLGGAAA